MLCPFLTLLASLQSLFDRMSARGQLLQPDLDIRVSFKNIKMAEETLLTLLSPITPVTIERIYSGSRAVQLICDNSFDNAEEKTYELLEKHGKNTISKLSQKEYSLSPQSSTHFKDFIIGEGEMILVLSSSTPITVENVYGEKGSVFIAGMISMAFMEKILEMCQVKFETNRLYGVFKVEAMTAQLQEVEAGASA